MEKIEFNPYQEIRIDKETMYAINLINDVVNTYNINAETAFLLECTDGTKDVYDLYREVKARYNHVKSDEFYNVIEALLEEKILVRQKKSDFNVNEKWSRQVLFWQKYTNDKNKALLAQKIIEESSVLIIGGGGTGTWVSYYLAQLGIKELSIIDYDKVEMSNLNRQILFEESDCGKYKSEVIKEKILKVNKETKVNSIIKMNCKIKCDK